MIRPIMTKQFFLRQPSEDAGASDAHIVSDLVDTLEGVRPARRYEQITVEYDDELVRPCAIERSGRVAQAIQHEIDHCNGVLI